MDRRAFLASSVASAAVASLPWRVAHGQSGWRTFEVTTRIDIQRPSGVSRAWIPLPLSASLDWHRGQGNAWHGNAARAEVLRDPKYGVEMLYAEWSDAEGAPYLEITSRFSTPVRDRAVDLSRPGGGAALSEAERKFFTAPTDLIPTDGIVRETAEGIVKGNRGDVGKARAIYEWVVDNSFRDPNVRGCGWGDIKAMLESKNLGGKCGDLNALYVGLARSVGVPARDVYGVATEQSIARFRSEASRSVEELKLVISLVRKRKWRDPRSALYHALRRVDRARRVGRAALECVKAAAHGEPPRELRQQFSRPTAGGDDDRID